MLAVIGQSKVVQGPFNKKHTVFRETAGIPCACMGLSAISYSTIQSELDIALIKRNALYKTLGRRTLLTAEGLSRTFKLVEGNISYKISMVFFGWVYQITAIKMKFSITDFFSKCDQIWSHLLKKSVMENFIFRAVDNNNLLDRQPNIHPDSQTTGSAFFIQVICFTVIPYNSYYYIFFVLIVVIMWINQLKMVIWSYLSFVTIEHVLNFTTTTYLTNACLKKSVSWTMKLNSS